MVKANGKGEGEEGGAGSRCRVIEVRWESEGKSSSSDSTELTEARRDDVYIPTLKLQKHDIDEEEK